MKHSHVGNSETIDESASSDRSSMLRAAPRSNASESSVGVSQADGGAAETGASTGAGVEECDDAGEDAPAGKNSDRGSEPPSILW